MAKKKRMTKISWLPGSRKDQQRMFTIVGYFLAGYGLLNMYLGVAVFTNLLVVYVGAVLIGGLPDPDKLVDVFRKAPAILIVSASLILFMVREYGADSLGETFVSTLIGIFIVGNLFKDVFRISLLNNN